ncbi:MAG: radical SAM protein, partial [Caldilineaceae bacterium]
MCGYTHTLQPYIGCRFGCAYCYVQGLQVHHFHQPALAWGDYVHPRSGIVEKLQRDLARHARAGRLESLALFMSSATDPYQPAERTWRLTRACLDVLATLTPGLLVVQTRSPLVREDFGRIAALGCHAWLSVTLETDDEAARRAMTPRCPSLAQRVALIEAAQTAGLNVQIAVSPCLPLRSVEGFGSQLLHLAGARGRVVVDTY